jgi:hypothetical protein
MRFNFKTIFSALILLVLLASCKTTRSNICGCPGKDGIGGFK